MDITDIDLAVDTIWHYICRIKCVFKGHDMKRYNMFFKACDHCGLFEEVK